MIFKLKLVQTDLDTASWASIDKLLTYPPPFRQKLANCEAMEIGCSIYGGYWVG